MINHPLMIVMLAVCIILVAIVGGGYLWRLKRSPFTNDMYASLFQSLTPWIILDNKHRVIQLNREFTLLNGYTLADIRGSVPFPSLMFTPSFQHKKHIIQALRNNGTWQGELSVVHKDTSVMTEIITLREIPQPSGVKYMAISFVDITHRKKVEEKLKILSECDGLTGIWNRRKFDAELRRFCNMVKRYPTTDACSLAIIDIDNFKMINDHFGHDYGDFIIRELSTLLKHHLRDSDFVARVGGEEFAIILRHTSSDKATIVLERIRTIISDSLPFTISGGLTELDDEPASSYKCADMALYQAKETGKNKIVAYRENSKTPTVHKNSTLPTGQVDNEISVAS